MKSFLRKLLKEQEESQYYKMTPQEYLDLMKLSGYHGSVTKLKRFEGKPIWITGPLDISRTPTDSLGNVVRIDGRVDISHTNIRDISGIEIKGHVWDSGTPRERIRLAEELREKREEAQERRQSGEWDLEKADDEGLKANALYQWLVDEGDIDVLDTTEKEELDSLKEITKSLNREYDDCEEDCDELYDQINEIDDRIEELENKITDVYVIYPLKNKYYGLNVYEVIDVDGFKDKEYVVGTEEEMDSAVLSYAENSIDDLGLDGFRESFIINHIDEDGLRDYMRETYEEDIWQNPEVYFTDTDFELTEEQEKRIEELENYIEKLEEYIERMEEEQSDLDDEIEDPDEWKERYNEIQKMIDDAETKKEKAQDELDSIEPDTEPTQDMVDDKVEDIVNRKMRSPIDVIREEGLTLQDWVDKDEMAKSLAEDEGYGLLNGYDGTYDSFVLGDEVYYIMRTN